MLLCRKNSLILPMMLLVGVGMLSACAAPRNLALEQQVLLDQLEIGKSTTADVEQRFGKPTGASVALVEGATTQSWAYAFAQMGTRPIRYLPYFGGLGVADVVDVESRAFSVNFSDQGVVQGFTQRKLARYTVQLAWPGSPEEVTAYGYRNLNARAGYISPTSY